MDHSEQQLLVTVVIYWFLPLLFECHLNGTMLENSALVCWLQAIKCSMLQICHGEIFGVPPPRTHTHTHTQMKSQAMPRGYKTTSTSFLSLTYMLCVCAAWTLPGRLLRHHTDTACSHVSNQRAASILQRAAKFRINSFLLWVPLSFTLQPRWQGCLPII